MNLRIEKYDHTKTYIGQSKFNCGNAVIDKFVQSGLKKQVKDNISQAYVVIDALNNNCFVGFYTINAYTLHASELAVLSKGSLPKIISCLRLVMLGVGEAYKSNGIGKKLLQHAINLTLKVSGEIGVYGLFLDADQKAVNFYRKHSFEALNEVQVDAPTPMFLSLETIKQALI